LNVLLQIAVDGRRPLIDIQEVNKGVSALRNDVSDVEGLLPDLEFGEFVDAAAECANKPIKSLVYRSLETKTAYRLENNKVEHVWLSSLPRDVNDITLCTQVDRTRLHMVQGQCEAWGGPMSVAVYIPLKYLAAEENAAALSSLKSELSELHDVVKAKSACTLDIVLISELRSQKASWAYPYNSNRNQALSRARTRLIFLLDADFLPNTGLRTALLQPDAWRAALRATHVDKQILVVPAFETEASLSLENGGEVASLASTSSKKQLQRMFSSANEVVQFAPFFPRGHGATNYSRWFATSEPYQVYPEVGYEPFVILSRQHVPPFDERFRGYGFDKITHLFLLNMTGYSFVVRPEGWVVHRPHAPSEAYGKSFTGPAYTSKHRGTAELKKLRGVAKDMMKSVERGTYPERGVTVLAGCGSLDLVFDPDSLSDDLQESLKGKWRARTRGRGQ